MDSSCAILAIEKLVTEGVAGDWRLYSSRLKDPDTTWTSTGILKAQNDGDGRIVLEALSHASFDGVVVRVYQEAPLAVHYAMRASSQARIDAITKEAAAVFESLPGHPDEEVAGGLENFGIDLGELLNPIPPPFQMEEIPYSEQAIAPSRTAAPSLESNIPIGSSEDQAVRPE